MGSEVKCRRDSGGRALRQSGCPLWKLFLCWPLELSGGSLARIEQTSRHRPHTACKRCLALSIQMKLDLNSGRGVLPELHLCLFVDGGITKIGERSKHPIGLILEPVEGRRNHIFSA